MVAFASFADDWMSQSLLKVLELFAWLTGAAGVMMGNALYFTVVRMGAIVNTMPSIKLAWGVFRDLGNILLIFGFILIGIATILDNATYGAKKTLPKLLLVALTLNFSLFVAEFIVDTGNMFATQFYTEINGGKTLTGNFNVSDEPISNAIMSSLGLTKIYDFNGNHVLKTQATSQLDVANNKSHWFITFFAAIILFAITAFVLGTIAIMLVARFVILLFLLIVSPIGFIGLAGIPVISGYGKKWWKALSDQTLFAPILLLLLLVVVHLIQEPTIFNMVNQGSITNTSAGGISNLLLGFSIVIGLLLSALIIAKSLSGKTAGFATKWSSRLTFGAIGGAIGGGARLLRGGAGILRGAAEITGNNKFSRGVGHLTRPIEHIARPIERFNFDPRRIPGSQALGIGKPEDISYRNMSNLARKYAPIVGEKGVLKAIKKENLREMDEERARANKNQGQRDIKENISKLTEAMEQLEAGKITKEQYDAKTAQLHTKLSKNLSDMPVKELSELKGIKGGVEAIATNLSPEKFQSLMDGSELLGTQKAKLSEARYKSTNKAVETITSARPGSVAHNKATKVIQGMSKKDIENAPQELLSNNSFLQSLTDKQADTLLRSDKLSSTQKTSIKDVREKRFGTPEGAKSIIGSMKLDQIAKLPDSVLTTPHVLKELSFQQTTGLLNNLGSLSNVAQSALVAHIKEEMRNDTPKGRQLINLTISDPTIADRWGI